MIAMEAASGVAVQQHTIVGLESGWAVQAVGYVRLSLLQMTDCDKVVSMI